MLFYDGRFLNTPPDHPTLTGERGIHLPESDDTPLRDGMPATGGPGPPRTVPRRRAASQERDGLLGNGIDSGSMPSLVPDPDLPPPRPPGSHLLVAISVTVDDDNYRPLSPGSVGPPISLPEESSVSSLSLPGSVDPHISLLAERLVPSRPRAQRDDLPTPRSVWGSDWGSDQQIRETQDLRSRSPTPRGRSSSSVSDDPIDQLGLHRSRLGSVHSSHAGSGGNQSYFSDHQSYFSGPGNDGWYRGTWVTGPFGPVIDDVAPFNSIGNRPSRRGSNDTQQDGSQPPRCKNLWWAWDLEPMLVVRPGPVDLPDPRMLARLTQDTQGRTEEWLDEQHPYAPQRIRRHSWP